MISIPATAAALAIKIWLLQTQGMSVIYSYDELQHMTTNSVQCGDCSPREALERMFAGRHVLIWQLTATAFTLNIEDGYCHPELGATAPLPPCLRYQNTLVVRN